MECAPTGIVVLETEALPEPSTGAAPKTVPPSLKVTEPVGWPEPDVVDTCEDRVTDSQ